MTDLAKQYYSPLYWIDDETQYPTSEDYSNFYDNFKMIPTSRPSIAPPGVKQNFKDIPGASGSLDLSSSLLGYALFDDREGDIEFAILDSYKGGSYEPEYIDNSSATNWSTMYTMLLSEFHGKKIYLKLREDDAYAYKGRVWLTGWTTGTNYSTVGLHYRFKPYRTYVQKTRIDVSSYDYPIGGANSQVFSFNSQAGEHGEIIMPVTPWIEKEDSITGDTTLRTYYNPTMSGTTPIFSTYWDIALASGTESNPNQYMNYDIYLEPGKSNNFLGFQTSSTTNFNLCIERGVL